MCNVGREDCKRDSHKDTCDPCAAYYRRLTAQQAAVEAEVEADLEREDIREDMFALGIM